MAYGYMEKKIENMVTEMQKSADSGNVGELAFQIAYLAWQCHRNRLDMLETRTFTVDARGSKKYVVKLPETINHYDLVSKIVAHGGAYFPEDGCYKQGKVITFEPC